MTPTGDVERPPELAVGRSPEMLTSLASFLSVLGIEAYLVGGAVRDMLLDREVRDLDVAVKADAAEVASDLASFLGGSAFPLDIERAIHRVVRPGAAIDLVGIDDIRADLARRDFTVDAMAVSVSELADGPAASLIDPHGGLRDLGAREIRMVTPTAFVDDPGRLMRAARLETQLGFTISPDTEALVRGQAGMVGLVSGERIRDELLSILAEPGATDSLRRLDDLGLLSAALPEQDDSRDVIQPKEHYWDVFGHAMETPGQVEALLAPKAGSEGFVAGRTPRFEGMDDYFAEHAADGHTRATMLKLAGLLHDIGKPATKTVEPSGRIRFIGHHTEGAEIARAALNRLRLSRRGVDMVGRMVWHHLRPGQMAQGDDLPSARAVYRYYRDVGDVAVDTVYLNLADYAAARGPMLGEEEWADRCRTAAHILKAGVAPDRPAPPRPLIDGHDIMDVFSLEPGPAVGAMLETVREAQAAGEVGSKEDALELVREKLKTGDAGA